MSTNSDRRWMYELDRVRNGLPTAEWLEKVEGFVNFALSHPECVRDGNNIKCPCALSKCQNTRRLDAELVKVHLAKNGFGIGYTEWIFHGEENTMPHTTSQTPSGETTLLGNIERMVEDAFGGPPPQSNIGVGADNTDRNESTPDTNLAGDEIPNPSARKFYDLIESAKKKLFNGKHSLLSITIELMSIKTDYQAPQALIDRVCKKYHDLWSGEDNPIPRDFYSAKKLVSGLGLPVEVIHSCVNHCMLYWKDDKDLEECKFCSEPRFKPMKDGVKRRRTKIPRAKMHYFPITPRLQRLYASPATASKMRWHAEHEKEDGKMCHPSDSTAWEHFNKVSGDFMDDARNVRLGLCTDGFQPFGTSGRPYSLWPIILTPYNLPPGMCMKDEFFFLSCLVPGPKNLKGKIDVYLQPLIQELQTLWNDGVNTYDISKKQNFNMRAALLWTISDFPAYAMLSGWSTAGRLACPYCGSHSDAFTLSHSKKQSWFDCHRCFLPEKHKFRSDRKSFRKGKRVSKNAPSIRTGEEILSELNELGLKKVTDEDSERVNATISKSCGWSKRSIFWDLPYWSLLMIRHNLDVMHIEKNVFDNLFNTFLKVKGKSKDNDSSRKELNDYCDRPSMAYDPTKRTQLLAPYELDKQSIEILCHWLKGVKFPDGYAANIGNCVDLTNRRVYGMKSHDCHVFMQRLLPIAIRHLLPAVWEPVTELCLFFKELTTTTLHQEKLCRMQEDIAVILCKLEKIFPPSFFNSMEHLPIHLAYEASVAGPVQYRWMYPFERYMGKLKRKVRNRNHIEGSICNGYLLEEITKFAGFYFTDEEPSVPQRMGRNEVCVEDIEDDERPEVFKRSGKPIGRGKTVTVTRKDLVAAHTYVLLNTAEMEPYVNTFVEQLRTEDPTLSDRAIEAKMHTDFSGWFEAYSNEGTVPNQYLRSLAMGPLNIGTSYSGFYVNGFKFLTRTHERGHTTANSGLCLLGGDGAGLETEFYGMLEDVLELEYPAYPIKRVILFRCHWFDTTEGEGKVIHRRYKMVDIRHERKYKYFEPFILADQAVQVYYCPYPSKKKDDQSWWAVCKTKAKGSLDMPEEITPNEETQPLQHEYDGGFVPAEGDDQPLTLVDVESNEELNDVIMEYEELQEIDVAPEDEDADNDDYESD